MKFLDRIKAAASALSGRPIPYPSGNGGSGLDWQMYGFPQYQNSAINYKREAGNLSGSSLIMAAVNWTGTALPEAPIDVKKRKGKSAKVFEPLPDHPMAELLSHPTRYVEGDETSEWYAGELLWKAFAFSWIIDGNVYFRKVRNPLGQVIQLWYEPHFTCRPRWNQDGSEFISYYEVERNGQWYPVSKKDVVHFRYGVDPERPQVGLSPVASLYREVFTDGERARYSSLILRNGGVVPFILSPDPAANSVKLDPKEIKNEFEYRTTGDNLGKPIVLTGAVKVQSVGSTPDTLLVDKASTIPEERVAAVIGIPAAVLGYGVGLEQTTVGATMRELREQAYESFLIPTWRLLAAELQSQLLPDFESDTKDLHVAHDLSHVRVLQDDRDKLFTRECLAYEKGIKKRSEVRSALGLDSDPKIDDVYYVLAASEQPKPEPLQLPEGDPQPKQLVNGKAKSMEFIR